MQSPLWPHAYTKPDFPLTAEWIFSTNDIPDNIPVHRHIFTQTNFLEKVKEVSSKNKLGYSQRTLNFDHALLAKDTLEAIDIYGMHPSRLSSANYLESTNSTYLSSSLTHNSQSIDNPSSNPHTSTLGSTIVSNGSFSNSYKWEAKNNYTDTLSFVERTPLSNHGNLGNFLNGFKRTLIRSRISSIMGGQDLSHYEYNWHNDESVFINLRINIPIVTSDEFGLQILTPNYQSDEVELNTIKMKEGLAYIYNTELPHRPVCLSRPTLNRINLICGISPWFDYIHETKTWVSNEYYGKLHPFEIFELGLCSNFIQN